MQPTETEWGDDVKRPLDTPGMRRQCLMQPFQLAEDRTRPLDDEVSFRSQALRTTAPFDQAQMQAPLNQSQPLRDGRR